MYWKTIHMHIRTSNYMDRIYRHFHHKLLLCSNAQLLNAKTILRCKYPIRPCHTFINVCWFTLGNVSNHTSIRPKYRGVHHLRLGIDKSQIVLFVANILVLRRLWKLKYENGMFFDDRANWGFVYSRTPLWIKLIVVRNFKVTSRIVMYKDVEGHV